MAVGQTYGAIFTIQENPTPATETVANRELDAYRSFAGDLRLWLSFVHLSLTPLRVQVVQMTVEFLEFASSLQVKVGKQYSLRKIQETVKFV